MYADYEFYKNEYFGELVDDTEFPKYESRTRNELDYYTCDRILHVKREDVMNKVKMCQCKLIDLFKNYDQEIKKIQEYEEKTIKGSVVSSETVGKHSVSFQKATLKDVKAVKEELEQEISMIIRRDLSITGLLYRGVAYV